MSAALPESATAPSRWLSRLLLGLSALAIAACGHWVIQGFPNSADEYAYLFQARNLARLQTHAQVHPPNAFAEAIQPYFYFVHIGETEGKYYGRFPFGYSLLLTPAAWVEMLGGPDVYALTNLILGVLTIALLLAFGRRLGGAQLGLFAAIMGLCSPWFLLTSASYFSHSAAAFFIGLCLLLFIRGLDQPAGRQRAGLLASSGLAFGSAVLVRFLDPLPFLPVLLLLWCCWQGPGRHLLKDGLSFVLGGLPCLLALLAYNQALTGSAWTTAYEYYNPLDQGTRFVFQLPSPEGTELDWSRVWSVGWAQNTWPNIQRLFDWHAWAWLAVLAPLGLLFGRRPTNQRLLIGSLGLSALLLIGIYLLYGGPPMNQYGPRYFYSAFVPLTLLAAWALQRLCGRSPWLWGPVFLALLSLTAAQLWSHAQHYAQSIHERSRLYRSIEASGIENAVVILQSGSGSMHQVDLARNALDFSNSVLIAQDLGGHHGPLRRAYPERNFYAYRDAPGPLGQLIPLPDSRPAPEAKPQAETLRGRQGLLGAYGPRGEAPWLYRVDPRIDFDWGRGSPDPRLRPDQFAVRWEGWLWAQASGPYRIRAESDDGLRLRIGEQLLIDHYTDHARSWAEGSLELAAGWHPIQIDYYEAGFDALLRVELIGPDGRTQVLGGKLLSPLPP